MQARVLLGVLLLTGCGAEDPVPSSGVPLPYGLGARPALPFPTDDARVADAATPTAGRIEIGAGGLGDVDESIFLLGEDFVRTLETLDGWSTIGPAFVSTGVPIDEATLAEHVALVDVDATEVVPAALQTVAGETDYGRPQAWIEARPEVPLAPKHRHALVVLDGLSTADGEPFVRNPTFAALYGDEGAPDDVDAARWARAEARQEGLQAALESAGIDPQAVLLADPYTTLSVFEETDRMLEVARARPLPTIELDADHDGAPDRYADPTDDPRGNVPNRDYRAVQALLRVTFEIPTFRADDESRLVVDAAHAEVQREETVEAIVLVPQGEGPFPVAVFHHGLGGRKETAFSFAADLCGLGFAVVAIDATLHGFRTDKPGNAGVRFLNVVSPALVLDNFRTAEIDQISLVRAIDAMAQLDLLGTGAPVLDPDRLVYVGVSLGAIVGAGVIGLEPRFEAAVLFVGGGSLLEFFDRVLSGFEFGGFPTRLFTTVAQSVLDRGDPSNYARRSRDTQILLMQALQDTVVPAGATESLARAMDLPLVSSGDRAARRGWTQFSGTHDLPLKSAEPNHAAARAQANHFLETWLSNGEAEISAP